MPSLCCRYLPDTFPHNEDQAPFLSVRMNVTFDELVSAYSVSFPTTFNASDLRKAPFACKNSSAGQPNFALPSCLWLEYHRGNNTPEPPLCTRLGFGSPLEAVDGRPLAREVALVSAGYIVRPSGT